MELAPGRMEHESRKHNLEISPDAAKALEEAKRRGCDTCFHLGICKIYPHVVGMEQDFKEYRKSPFKAIDFAQICEAYIPVAGGA